MSVADEITKLRGTRNVYIRHIKNIDGELAGLVANIDLKDETAVCKLTSLRDSFEEKWVAIKGYDDGLINLMEQGEGEKELGDVLIRNDKYRESLTRADIVLKKVQNEQKPPAATATASPPVTARNEVKVRLPKFQMKVFDGDILNWQSFWDQFQSSIHSMDYISDIDKFNYLKSLMSEEANETIAGLNLTAANYKEAVDLLQKRYGNKQVLINTYMKKFISIPSIKSIHDVEGLRSLYNQVESYVRNLRTLDVGTESYGALLVPLLNERLPGEFRVLLARKFKDNVWTLDEMLECLESEVDAKERASIPGSDNSKQQDKSNKFTHFSTSNLYAGNFSGHKERLCVYCNEAHSPTKCLKVTDPAARKGILRKKGNCFICLKHSHTARSCPSKYSCYRCGEKHHISICASTGDASRKEKYNPPNQPNPLANAFVPTTTATSVSTAVNNILLQTARAEVSNLNYDYHSTARLLFDSGSQRSYITQELKNKLRLHVLRKEPIIIKTFGSDNSCINEVEVVGVKVNCPDRSIVVEALVVPMICSDLVGQSTKVVAQKYSHLRNLYLADCSVEGKMGVDMLIGLDYYYSFITGTIVRGGVDEPIALQSSWGWILSGKFCEDNAISTTAQLTTSHTLYTNTHADTSLNETLKNFWNLDTLGISKSEDDVYDHFKKDLNFNGERYVTKLPFKSHTETLPDNFSVAKSRLCSLKNKLDKDPKLRDDYAEVIETYKKEGIVELVDDSESWKPAGSVHYLPHRGIVKIEKTTSKLRIVFDGSAKFGKQASLNDMLYSGPCLLPLLYDILLRFRIGEIGIVADIKQAFLQIEVAPEHRDFLRFLWFDDVKTDEPTEVIMRFTRVLFGITSGPFLLGGTIEVHLQKYIEKGVDVSLIEKLLRDLYVDDSANSLNGQDFGYEFFKKSRMYLAEGGFNLRKWATNDKSLRRRIYETLDDAVTENPGGIRKVLGINWDTDSDEFIFEFSDIVNTASSSAVTKRNILRVSAMFFDPLGLICPIVLQTKLFFKRLCLNKLDWDDPAPDDINSDWTALIRGLKQVGAVRINRHVFGCEGEVERVELHGFCDSSGKAYGAALYVRIITNTSIYVNLWTAKCRLAPMKETSIPRLELLSCLLLAKLISSVKSAAKVEVAFQKVVCWSDSQIALYWLKQTRKEWKPWVENRVTQIRELVDTVKWRYVRTDANPADIATRKGKPNDLINRHWLNGPEFLRLSDEHWEVVDVDLVEPEGASGEEKLNPCKTAVFETVCESVDGVGTLLDCERFKTLNKLLRVTAYVLRFIHNWKTKVTKQPLMTGDLSVTEIAAAEGVWIKFEQRFIKNSTNYEKLKVSLNLYVDDDEVLRSKSRVSGVESITFNRMQPILLRNDSRFTNLIIFRAHGTVCHQGVESTLNQVRGKYWIIRGRQSVKSVLRKCVICRIVHAKPALPPSTPLLPEFRVECGYAFENVGLDYAGPLLARDIYSNNKDMHKCYILLFTCATTRGIHLELTVDMSVTSLIMALKRFISRRGLPRLFISDNFTSFKSKELKEFLVNNDVSWKFILEKSPWWGGFYERLVKVVKDSLKKTISKAHLRYDELNTILCEVENAINSRPLTYLSDENFQDSLTPYHLIYGRNINSRYKATEVKEFTRDEMSTRSNHLKIVLGHFTNRFYTEYVSNLRDVHQYQNKRTNDDCYIKVGDIVIITEDKIPRMRWKKAKVEHLIIGRDNKVRGAELTIYNGKTEKTGTLRRPLQYLVPLEVPRKSLDDKCA